MGRLTPDQKIEQLDGLEFNEASIHDHGILQRAIKAKHNRLVAKAAKICGQHYFDQYIDLLKIAFYYFLEKPDKDKGCFAKKAIIQTLFEMDHLDDGFYESALDYRQREPVWGGSVDTAVEVRCWAALGLTLSPNSRIVFLLLDLLHDEEPQARLGAVKAISCLALTQAELLLREKVLDGDEDAYVIGECFHQLVTIEPDYSLGFVTQYLQHEDEEWVEYAALAIAQCNTEEALQILIQTLEDGAFGDRQKHLIKAIALHRSTTALTYLLSNLQQAGLQRAIHIVTALSHYRGNDEIRDTVTNKVNEYNRAELSAALSDHWD